MNDSVRKNAEIEIDQKTRAHMQRHGVDYRTAYYKVVEGDPDLNARYQFGSDAVTKKYAGDTLSPARREMAILQADPDKVRQLAGWVVDSLARRQLQNVGPGVALPVEEYKRALAGVRKENPNLARAERDGYIAEDDWSLLGLLVPSVAGQVERGNYMRKDSGRCSDCGDRVEYCNGRKLARQRHVDENRDVKAFAECIMAARAHGDELDKIRCFYE
jgi:hypothetical protein